MDDCKVIKYSETIRVSLEYFCPNKKVKRSIKLINPKITTKSYGFDHDCIEEKFVTFKCKICHEEHTFRM